MNRSRTLPPERAASTAAKSAEQIPCARKAAAEVMHDLADMLMPSTPKKKQRVDDGKSS